MTELHSLVIRQFVLRNKCHWFLANWDNDLLVCSLYKNSKKAHFCLIYNTIPSKLLIKIFQIYLDENSSSFMYLFKTLFDLWPWLFSSPRLPVICWFCWRSTWTFSRRCLLPERLARTGPGRDSMECSPVKAESGEKYLDTGVWVQVELSSWAHHPFESWAHEVTDVPIFPRILIFQPSYKEINIYWQRFINIAMFIHFQNVRTRYKGQCNTQHRLNVYIGDFKEDMTAISSYVC